MTVYALYYPTTNVGTPMLRFDLEMALAPGMSEDTRLKILTKALSFWQNVAATSQDPNRVFLANTAVGWIQSETTRIQSPPINTLRVTYPV